MAEKATEKATAASTRGKQLQATVSSDVYDAYEDYHWEARKNTVDIVRDALHEYGVKRGFLITGADGEVTRAPAKA